MTFTYLHEPDEEQQEVIRGEAHRKAVVETYGPLGIKGVDGGAASICTRVLYEPTRSLTHRNESGSLIGLKNFVARSYDAQGEGLFAVEIRLTWRMYSRVVPFQISEFGFVLPSSRGGGLGKAALSEGYAVGRTA